MYDNTVRSCIVDLVHALQANMSDKERIELWDELMDGYCHYCGCDDLPCYCQADD